MSAYTTQLPCPICSAEASVTIDVEEVNHGADTRRCWFLDHFTCPAGHEYGDLNFIKRGNLVEDALEEYNEHRQALVELSKDQQLDAFMQGER